MIERFLTDVVGVPWDDVHEEAEHLEHAMTPRFEAYVRSAVGDAKTCPHGHPIRVGERIDGVAAGRLRGRRQAHDPPPGERGRGSPALPEGDGVEPGLEGELASSDEHEVTVRFPAGEATITRSVAETVSVLADPSPPPRIALPEQLVLGRERYGR